MARGISVKDDCFTSQLNVTINATLQGRSVRCSIDNGTHASQVGSDTLALSTGMLCGDSELFYIHYSLSPFFIVISTRISNT